jgi:TonB-dependent SusC/RagA subfamily outer membrane receptor
MIVLWMSYTAGVGVLLAMAGRAAEDVMRAWDLPVRWVWCGALLLLVALPMMASIRGAEGSWLNVGESFASSPSAATGTANPPSASTEGSALIPEAMPAAGGWSARAIDLVGREPLQMMERPVGAVWVGLTGLLLLMLIWTITRARSVRRRWPIQEVLGHRVRVAPGVGPAVLGFLRPEIVLPGWLLDRPAEEVRLALDHEQEHVHAGDPRLLLFGSIVTILLPWNPIAWWMHARLRLAVEMDCDRRVMAAGAGQIAYGSLLVDIASRASGGRLGGAMGLIGAPSHLERRIRAMTTTVRYVPARIALFGGAAALALLAACETELPTAAQIEAMDVLAAEAGAARVLESAAADEIAFIVDGVQVEPSFARSIPSEEIEAIRVLRGPVTGGNPSDSDSARVLNSVEIPSSGSDVAIAARRPVADTIPVNQGGAIEIETRGAARATAVPSGRPPRIHVDGVVIRRSGTDTIPVDRGGAIEIETRGVAPATAAPSGRDPRILVDGVIIHRSDTDTIRIPARISAVTITSSQPLVIVDGVIVAGRSVNLEALDIESIEVIKGAAAARIYGERGAPGVIRITTKSGAAVAQ